uniref:GINS complex subunit 2 n=1 Tax=Syphacia muris TaxID=451379 RepID=A0A0N5ALL6_9BILA
MNPEFCEFLAENDLEPANVEDYYFQIKPNFSSEQLQLICGDIGPFEAGIPISVPLWVAIFLKKRHSCELIHSFQSQKFSKIRFQVPEWFTVENLGKMIVAENDDTSFTPVPRHFLEMSRIFLYHFKDDVVDGDQLRVCVIDLWDKRVSKMRSSTLSFLPQIQSCHARMDNITPLEICYAKSPMRQAIKIIEDLHTTRQNVTPL